TAIISLSFSRGVKFTKTPILSQHSARPHCWHLKRSMKKSVELLEHASQRCPQIVGVSRSKATDRQSANQRRGTVAVQRRSEIANEFERGSEFCPEVNERRKGGA